MRRSSSTQFQSNSQVPRRSSSTDGSNWNSYSQPNQFSQMNRQSSIGCIPGRASSIGRPSMGSCLKPEAKPINQQELAQSILTVLQTHDFKTPMTVKQLLLPSTGTFYSIFEVEKIHSFNSTFREY